MILNKNRVMIMSGIENESFVSRQMKFFVENLTSCTSKARLQIVDKTFRIKRLAMQQERVCVKVYLIELAGIAAVWGHPKSLIIIQMPPIYKS